MILRCILSVAEGLGDYKQNKRYLRFDTQWKISNTGTNEDISYLMPNERWREIKDI